MYRIDLEKTKVIFPRKILPCGVDKSYGIHVAQLAGLPRSFVNRANEVMAKLENAVSQKQITTGKKKPKQEPIQQNALLLAGSHHSLLIEFR